MILTELVAKLGIETEGEAGLEKVNHLLEGVHRRLEILAAGEILRGVFELAERFSGLGEQIESAAASAGLTAESFQMLAFSASQSAVSQEALSGALFRLNRQLGAAREGTGETSKAFEKLKISPDQLRRFKDSREAFLRIADAVSGVQDPFKKAAIVQELFGRSGNRMLKYLNLGSKGIKELEQRGKSIGAIVGDEDIENLAEFEDAMSGLYQVFRSLGAYIGATFAPAIKEVVEIFEDLFGANQKLIRSTIEDWAEKTIYAFGVVVEVLRLSWEALNRFIDKHEDLVKWAGRGILAMLAFSIAVSVLQFAFSKLVQPIIDTIGWFVSLGKTGGKVFEWLVWAFGPVKALVVWLLERLALLAVEAFPAVGEAIFVLAEAIAGLTTGAFLGWVAAAVLALVGLWYGVKALWEMWNGKKFWDTELGKALKAVVDWGGRATRAVKRFLHIGGGEEPKAEIGPMGIPTYLQNPDGAAPGMGILGQAAGAMGGMDFLRMAQLGQNGMNNLGALATPGGVPPMLAAPMAAAAPGSGPATVNLATTVNLQVPPGADPRQIAEEVRKKQVELQQQLLREAARDGGRALAW